MGQFVHEGSLRAVYSTYTRCYIEKVVLNTRSAYCSWCTSLTIVYARLTYISGRKCCIRANCQAEPLVLQSRWACYRNAASRSKFIGPWIAGCAIHLSGAITCHTCTMAGSAGCISIIKASWITITCKIDWIVCSKRSAPACYAGCLSHARTRLTF